MIGLARSPRARAAPPRLFGGCRAGWLALGCLLALAGALVPASVAAQGRIVASHGDWQIRCEQPVGAPSEQCALVQNVEAQDRANVGLTVIFLHTADREARILRVLAPLGVLLPSGLGLSIDANEVGLAGFVRCLPEGCIAEVELDDGLIERFEAGETATFVIFQTPEAGIGIPISLNGFSEGFAALDDPPPSVPLSETEPPEAPQTPVETETRTVAADTSGTPGTAERDEGAGLRTIAVEEDDRSAIDRLLEDELLPYVAGAVALIVLALVLLFVLVGRARRSRRRSASRQERREPVTKPSGSPGEAGKGRRAAPSREADAPPHEETQAAAHEDGAVEREPDEDALTRGPRPARRERAREAPVEREAPTEAPEGREGVRADATGEAETDGADGDDTRTPRDRRSE